MSKRTPLYDTHRALGARMIEFGGWMMPVQYSGILTEHQTVRTTAGLFDLSHMGEIEVSGPRALEVCQELLVTDVARVQLGQAQYSVLCYPDGGIVDDIIVYHLAEQHYFLCVNAANIEKDFAWLTDHNHGRDTGKPQRRIRLDRPPRSTRACYFATRHDATPDDARPWPHPPLLVGIGRDCRCANTGRTDGIYRRRWV